MKPILRLVELTDIDHIVDCTFWIDHLHRPFINPYDNYSSLLSAGFKPIKPYGISTDELIEGDKYYSDITKNVRIATMEDVKTWRHTRAKGFPHTWFKVVILPEQFNYQKIVDLGLKDGDEFEVKTARYYNLDYPTQVEDVIDTHNKTGKVSISKPQPVLYTEEEVYNLINKFYKRLALEGQEYFAISKDRIDWFNQNKKK